VTNLVLKKRHTEKGSILTFDVEKLKKTTKSYESETKIQVKLKEHSPDGYEGSDGFSEALTTSEENHDIEITNNQLDTTNISEENLNNNVNNTIEKNEDAADVPVKPSDPSELSVNLHNNTDKKDGHIVKDMIKPENSPTCSIKASPPSELQCYYCKQYLPSQSELIAHMDKESADAQPMFQREFYFG
jgi:hypothetical protein